MNGPMHTGGLFDHHRPVQGLDFSITPSILPGVGGHEELQASRAVLRIVPGKWVNFDRNHRIFSPLFGIRFLFGIGDRVQLFMPPTSP